MTELNNILTELNAANLVFKTAIEDLPSILDRALRRLTTAPRFPLASQDDETGELAELLGKIKTHLNGGEALLMDLRTLEHVLKYQAPNDLLTVDDLDALKAILGAFRRFDAASTAMKRWAKERQTGDSEAA